MSLKNYLVLIKKCTFNKKLLIILKGYAHSLRHRFINQKKCKDGSSYFYKNEKHRRLEKEKKISVISFKKLLIFPIWAFSENAQCFVGAFL